MEIILKDGKPSILKVTRNHLKLGEIICIKGKTNEYSIAIILSKQVIFGGNFCAFFKKTFSQLPSETELKKEIDSQEYDFLFVDFYDALKDGYIFQIAKNFETESIFCGKIKTKEYIEDFDEQGVFFSDLNLRERLEEKEIEELFTGDEISIVSILLDTIHPEEIEESGMGELLAFHQELVEKNEYFYSIKEIDKINYTPQTMVKAYAQSPEEKDIPEVRIGVYQINDLLGL